MRPVSVMVTSSLTSSRGRDLPVVSGITRHHVALAGAFIAAHVVLAIVMRAAPTISTAHAVACLVGGIGFALTTRQIRKVAVVVAYMAGCEVLWRMTRANVPYEFGKYSVIVVLSVALTRMRWSRNRALALTYLGLLLPSIALTLVTLSLDVARQQIAFNMSAPVAITVTVMFFSNIRLTTNQQRAIFLGLIGPVAGIGALATISTSSMEVLEFGNGSNIVTSGGFGPNQVSAMLGLAVMFLLLISFERVLSWRLRLPALVLAAGFAALSALTFARGGVGLALAGTTGAMFVIMQGSRRGRMTVLTVAVLSFAIGKYVVEPRLDAITNGKLSERYTSSRSSGRDVYAGTELDLFSDNPVLGVGPGVGTVAREGSGMIGAASHTEYTRMLAEHGILGILSLGCLIALAARAIRQSRDLTARAHALAMVIWVGLFLLIYGTRLVAPAFVFGLAFVLPAVSSPSRTKNLSSQLAPT